VHQKEGNSTIKYIKDRKGGWRYGRSQKQNRRFGDFILGRRKKGKKY